jgi:Cu-Zn family superoxide dismutase
VIFATISMTGALIGCTRHYHDTILAPAPAETSTATAAVRGYTDSSIRGTVRFEQFGDSVRVTAAIAGLAPSKAYAIHVHQIGNCSSPEASGEHFALNGERHGDPFDTLPAHHRGDLPNLQVGAAGIGQMTFSTAAFNLNPASASDSMSILGRSVVVHANPDDYVTQPAGNSDGRIACGVIMQGNASGTGAGAGTTGNGTGTTGNGTGTTGTGTGTTGTGTGTTGTGTYGTGTGTTGTGTTGTTGTGTGGTGTGTDTSRTNPGTTVVLPGNG